MMTKTKEEFINKILEMDDDTFNKFLLFTTLINDDELSEQAR